MANMVIEFDDAAYESFQNAVDRMHDYGVEITLDGETFDAILLGSDRANEDGAAIQFIRVVDEEYDRNLYPGDAVEVAVVDRIVVS